VNEPRESEDLATLLILLMDENPGDWSVSTYWANHRPSGLRVDLYPPRISEPYVLKFRWGDRRRLKAALRRLKVALSVRSIRKGIS